MVLGDRVDAVLQIGHTLGCRRDIDALFVGLIPARRAGGGRHSPGVAGAAGS
jgi:hypothetical protein